jgi:serine/threonine protein kinase
MEPTIERRQRRELFWYVMRDSDFFENLSTGVTVSDEYQGILDSVIPPDWRVTHEGVWLHVHPPAIALPPQGFKIHVSGTSPTASEILRRVAPICVAHDAAFKLTADPLLLELTTSKNSSRGSSGKFITIYPGDRDHFVSLMKALDRATSDLTGPYILSDKRYAGNRVLFYRYGGIAPRVSLNVFGEMVPVIESSDGHLIPDVRAPFFHLPDGVDDPFASEDATNDGPVLLNNRYLVTALLVHSNAGGVYKAEDQHTGRTVVVKEARPLISVTRRVSEDAVDNLRKEACCLQKLAATGYVPQYVDLFQEWEHTFLVEEYVEGTLLSSYRARTDVGLIFQRNPTPEGVKLFCGRIFNIARQLTQAISAFHDEGVLVGDLSPYNVIIDPETEKITIIDFEAARIVDESARPTLAMFTPGFASPARHAGAELSPQDDYYALGSILYSLMLPVQEVFRLNADAASLFIDELTRDFGLPHSVKQLIFQLLDGQLTFARQIAESNGDSLELTPVAQPRTPARAEIRGVIDGIAQYLLAKTDVERQDRLWPSDYRLFSTNPLSIAYGALGTALFLKQALGTLPATIEDWIDRQPLSVQTYPPGLFMGLSGIAWGLDCLGATAKAAAAFDLALQSPLLSESPDVFYGTAGIGLTGLHLFTRTGESRFLDAARALGDSLIARASPSEQGCHWTNTDGPAYFGFAHGSSGIAYFLLNLHLATGDARYLSYARAGVEFEVAHARIDGDRAVWGRAQGDYLEAPYWRLGASGVGSVLIRFAAILGERRYRELAEKAANAVVTKYAILPQQFSGLSGIGEFLLDMYVFTGERRYLDDALRLARGVLLYQITRPEGIAFPGEELMKICADYGTGSAGVGLFLLRLLEPSGRLFYDIQPTKGSALDVPAEPLAGCQYLLARCARLGPLCESQRAQDSRNQPHSGPGLSPVTGAGALAVAGNRCTP